MPWVKTNPNLVADIDLSAWENHNTEVLEGVLCVRRAFKSHAQATDLQASSVFVGAFSVEAPNVSEVASYLFVQNTTTRQVTLYVVDEELRTLFTYPIGQLPLNPVITLAIQNQQLLINSPHFRQPLFGIVGGGLKAAESVASVNPNTTVLPAIPLGICTTFADRIVVANGNSLFINDPGTEIRTFVAANQVHVPGGTIYDVFQAAQGLYVFTTDGLYIMPTDVLSAGQVVAPFLVKAAAYDAFSYRNAAISNGSTLALSKRGLVDVDKDTTLPLTSFSAKRTLTKPVGFGPAGDYRAGQIWPTANGFAVSANKCIAWIDVHNQAVSWFTANADLTIVGMLKTRDGADIIVTPDRILELWGTEEFTGIGFVDGTVCGVIPTTPEASQVLRFVTTSSNNVGRTQRVAVRGTLREATTPRPANVFNAIGSGTWNTVTKLVGAESRSCRHAFAVRADEFSVEIGIQGALSKIAVADVLLRGQGAQRP